MQIFFRIAKQQYKVEQEQRAILADAKLYVTKNVLVKQIKISESDIPVVASVYSDDSVSCIVWLYSYKPFTTPKIKSFKNARKFIYNAASKNIKEDFLKHFKNPFRFTLNGSKEDCDMLYGGMFYFLKYISIPLYAVLCYFA